MSRTWPIGTSPYTASIHILDDDSLLNIFYLHRPVPFEEQDDEGSLLAAKREWIFERWWYRLAHACQRWRNLIYGLILGSTFYLGICLVCTYGTPIADMLARLPPLPLTIKYIGIGYSDNITTEDEQGMSLALEWHDRVRSLLFRICRWGSSRL